MKHRDEIEALEARLARALRDDEGPELASRWRTGVMEAVRIEAARAGARDRTLERILRNVFVAATAAAAGAVAFLGPRIAALDPTSDLGRLVASDPQGLLQLVLVL
jgi:hypothetical protein